VRVGVRAGWIEVTVAVGERRSVISPGRRGSRLRGVGFGAEVGYRGER
jgi:hypothetical protein